MHNLCIFWLFFSKITFYWKLFSDCCDQFGYPVSIVYLSCFTKSKGKMALEVFHIWLSEIRFFLCYIINFVPLLYKALWSYHIVFCANSMSHAFALFLFAIFLEVNVFLYWYFELLSMLICVTWKGGGVGWY